MIAAASLLVATCREYLSELSGGGCPRGVAPRVLCHSCCVAAVVLAGCSSSATDRQPAVSSGTLAAPGIDDRERQCVEVADARACWEVPVGGAAESTGTWVARPLPSGAAPASGWRCSGRASERKCVARSLHGAPFECEEKRCAQRPVRAPDNSEWECVEMEGVVVCRFHADAAGIASGALDPAFLCAPRRGSAERICVDFSPDLPPRFPAFKCSVRYEAGGAVRVCSASKEPRVGGACSARAPCPRDAACVEGRCLPPRPSPACWLDEDCAPAGRCRWGSCLAAP